ncbi:putative bifunctional diguanylate cyclase/phosphodiesterase [Kineococcus terrestris]|uniref:putative bifunctional diguanylate cyclase/phosphodiesterase n=1 Tax=Kineococcus terrestris TaxID=2044856 RepID=UPI0034DAF592
MSLLSGARPPHRPPAPSPAAPAPTARRGPLRWLPRGHALPELEWRRRHRWVCAVLLVHVVAVPLYALLWRMPVLESLAFGAVLALLLGVAQLDELRRHAAGDEDLPPRLPNRVRSCASSLGLVVASGFVVQISQGWTEAHFHFFVMVPVVALYEAWAPFTVAVGYVLFQHGIVGAVFPRVVFHNALAHDHPWYFAGVHAVLFAAACAGALTTWRLAEASRLRQEGLLAQMQHRATHDTLTGLPNRAALRTRLEEALGADPHAEVSVLMIDLDRFKEVNDTLGHACGDDLLRQVATRLSTAIRGHDVLTRLGGDEFAVVLPGSGGADAHRVAERLRHALTGDLQVAGISVDVDASVGVATRRCAAAADRGDVAEEIENLLRRADIAMYTAKERGAGVAVYDPADDEHSSQRLSTLADLRTALQADDQLFLHYQTKVDAGTGAVHGVEALVRWRHPHRGLLAPFAFVPVAESTALAEPLTWKVLSLALRQVSAWSAMGHEVQVAVNVPPRCVQRRGFVETVLDHLAAAGVPSRQLRLEITEGTLLTDPAGTAEVLGRLRQAGVSISVDDFGTGFSSLSYLRSLPIDELKIDKSFVMGLDSPDPLARNADEVLVRSIVDLAHGLSLQVVAEGIENADVHRTVLDAGCDLAQGYHFSRPASAEDVTALLRERSRAALQD